ncbi:MAG: hypothetical protein C0605_17170, partial [Hyphomicrobiales bacterium]
MSIREENPSATEKFVSLGEESVRETDDSQRYGEDKLAQAEGNQPPGDDIKPVDPAAAAPQGQSPATNLPYELAPDANNIVRLPVGVSLDNVSVQGADLVLTQPGGQTITIKNAALNIPTFYLGNVEIPQLTLTAALEANGINVAAGPDGTLAVVTGADSSGGNFGVPVPGIGPADPILDLLPPTALSFPELTEPELYLGELEEDTPPTGGNPIELLVDDENLRDGTDPIGGPVTDSGPAAFTAGSNPLVTFAFSVDLSNLHPSLNWQYVSPTQIIGWDGPIGGGTQVVQLDVAPPAGGSIPADATGSATVTVTLLNNYAAHPLFTADDTIDLGAVDVIATDTAANSATTEINLNVSDDLPVIVSADNEMVIVDEDDLPDGIGDTADGDDTPQNATGD